MIYSVFDCCKKPTITTSRKSCIYGDSGKISDTLKHILQRSDFIKQSHFRFKFLKYIVLTNYVQITQL